MADQRNLEAVLRAAEPVVGLRLGDPEVLSHGSHLVIGANAEGTEIVIRMVASLPRLDHDVPGGDQASLGAEIDVARHLDRRGVGVVRPLASGDAGPHRSDLGWFTVWERAQRWLAPIGPADFRGALDALHAGLADRRDLPRLGAWRSIDWSRAVLSRSAGAAYGELDDLFAVADAIEEELGGLADQDLVPSHGDAHPSNVMESRGRLAWIDFEDASLMPAFSVNITLLGCALETLGREDRDFALRRVANVRGVLDRVGWDSANPLDPLRS